MTRNQIIGRVIAFSDKQTITSQQSGNTIEKRQLYIDCTRYDSLTGERGYENTPLLEFTNKGLEKLEGLITNGLKKDDVVTIFFDIQGNKWQNKDSKTQIITSIRPYDIELTRPGTQQPTAAAQPAAQPAAPQEPDRSGDNALPF